MWRARPSASELLRRVSDNLHFLVNLRAIGHLDQIHAIKESLVVLVVPNVCHSDRSVGENNALERNRAETFRALEVAFLRYGQRRVQMLSGALNISTNSNIP